MLRSLLMMNTLHAPETDEGSGGGAAAPAAADQQPGAADDGTGAQVDPETDPAKEPGEGEESEGGDAGEGDDQDEEELEQKKPAAAAKPKEEPAKEPEDELEPMRERVAQERAGLNRRAADLEAREAKLKTAESEVADLRELKDLKASAKNDPIGYLEAAGITWEDVAKAVRSGRTGTDPATRKAMKLAEENAAKVKQLEEERDRERAEAQQKAQDEGIRQVISSEIDKSKGLLKHALRLAHRDPARARAQVEREAFRGAVAYYNRYGVAPKLSKLFAEIETAHKERHALSMEAAAELEEKQPAGKEQPKPAEKRATRLTNDLDAAPTSAKPERPKAMTRAEEIQQEVDDFLKEKERRKLNGRT